MDLKITCDVTFHCGAVVLRHTVPGEPGGVDNYSIFGIPYGPVGMTEEEARAMGRALSDWLMERFRAEADATVRRHERLVRGGPSCE